MEERPVEMRYVLSRDVGFPEGYEFEGVFSEFKKAHDYVEKQEDNPSWRWVMEQWVVDKWATTLWTREKDSSEWKLHMTRKDDGSWEYY